MTCLPVGVKVRSGTNAVAPVGLAAGPNEPPGSQQRPRSGSTIGYQMDRTITVSATGTVEVVPDIAHFTAAIVADAASAGDALKRNSTAMAALIAGLKTAGIEARDIVTRGFQLEPRYVHENDGRAARIDGYQATNEVAVTVRSISRLGSLLDEIVRLGATRMSGLTFEFSAADKLRDEARWKAVANARRKAELYAKAAGAEVGQVMVINELPAGPGPRPLLAARMATSDEVPVEKGSQSLEANVTVTWELK